VKVTCDMPEDENLTDVQPKMTSAEERVAYFEKRMNYKCKGLTTEQQDMFDAKWHAASKLKRWPVES